MPADTAVPASLALVHDYLLVLRGAERTFAEMADIWPDAPIYTLLYDSEGTDLRFEGHSVRTSPLQRLGVRQDRFRQLFPLYQSAVRRLSLDDYRLVVSSSSAFAHGVRTAPGATHVCYCHSPFRYAWHERNRALAELPAAASPLVALALRRHRGFDRDAARRVTRFIANSAVTQARIRRYWGREAKVIHPPVDVERFSIKETDDYLLYVGEVVGHKRVDLALEAAERAGRRLRVVGTGPALEPLRARYSGTGEFLGRVTDRELTGLYARATALVVPNIEEFGIAAVEAQASGRPVIAADGGGARETVVPGETGWLVPPDDCDGFARAMRRSTAGFDPETIRRHALQFSPNAFRRRLVAAVADPRER